MGEGCEEHLLYQPEFEWRRPTECPDIIELRPSLLYVSFDDFFLFTVKQENL